MRIFRKLPVILFPIIVCLAFMLATTTIPQYVEIPTVPLYLKKLGILTGDKDNITNEQFNSYLSNTATKKGAVFAIMRLMGSKDISDQSSDNTTKFRFAKDHQYNFTQKILVTPATMALSSIQAYKYMFIALGYSSSDYTNTDAGVMEKAKQIGFGFTLPVSNNKVITNNSLAAILYEAIYANTKHTNQQLYRLLIQVNPEFKKIAISLGLIDNLPNYIPIFNFGRYNIGTFKELKSVDEAIKINKNEWEASYVNVAIYNYNNYKATLQNYGWVLDSELKRTTDGVDETIALFYKTINSIEYYCVVTILPSANTATVWIAG